MQRVAGQLRFSPSDLGDFVACEHLTQLELAMAMSGGARPAGENAFAELLQRKGEAHELAYLQSLRERGHAVVEVRLGEARDWEAFLNGSTPRERLTARYLYEHLFLAHLYFTSAAASGPPAFLRLVRSRTSCEAGIDEIATSPQITSPHRVK